MKRVQNVSTIERWLRVLGGGTVALLAILALLAGPLTLLWGVAEVALVLLGADFVVTGITGYCPLYHKLGWSTAARAGGQQPG